uniref:Uncharacterized protein n=1 Tax=Neogobius melanostomus TaxID=47308 RepID=A0A8C6WFC2_9GOBI
MGTTDLDDFLDPLPMHGRDLGVNPDDLMEAPEPEQENKQEILENKDVFQAKNLVDVMKRSHVARQKLLRLGCSKTWRFSSTRPTVKNNSTF